MTEQAALERREVGTDEAVVARILAGEVDLYEVLMRRYNQRLYRVARGIVRDDAEAEDVMQDAYVRAYEHLARFRGDASFATWLTRIAVHTALARLRRRRHTRSLDEETAADPQRVPTNERDAEERTLDRELRAVLESAIDALPARFRTVFILREVEEMRTADVATALSIPEDTVKTRLFRARGMLQRSIAAQLDASTREAFGFERPRCDRVVARVVAALRGSDAARARRRGARARWLRA